LAYPNVLHDDLVDSVATAVLYFEKNKGRRVTATQLRYTDV
jgi:phage terminase large subunit-like protein